MDSSSYSSNDNEEKRPKLVWNRNVERLLSTWCDLAMCHKWMHEKSYRKYKTLNYYYSIPIIILTTLTGTVSVGMGTLFPNNQQTAQIVVGGVNIITGIVTTLQNFFRYAQLSESHLNAFMGWSRLHRNIMIELNLERKSRRDPSDFVKICRNEYDRLMEQQPLYPPEVVADFKQKFKDIPDLILPDVADNIRHTIPIDDSPKASLSNKKMSTLKKKLLEKLAPEDKKNHMLEHIDQTINLQKNFEEIQIPSEIKSEIKSVKDTVQILNKKPPRPKPKIDTTLPHPPVRKDIVPETSINVKDLIKKLNAAKNDLVKNTIEVPKNENNIEILTIQKEEIPNKEEIKKNLEELFSARLNNTEKIEIKIDEEKKNE
jgi:hypothetical protein